MSFLPDILNLLTSSFIWLSLRYHFKELTEEKKEIAKKEKSDQNNESQAGRDYSGTFFAKITLTVYLIILSLLGIISTSERQSHPFVSFFRMLTLTLVVVLNLHLNKIGIASSKFLFIFWFILFIEELVKYSCCFITEYSVFTRAAESNDPVPPIGLFAILGILVILSKDDDNKFESEDLKSVSPENVSNLPSKLTFSWINPLLEVGYRRALSEDDLYSLDDSNSTRVQSAKFERLQSEAPQRAIRQNSQFSIIYPLLKMFWPEMILTAFFEICTVLISFADPILLSYLITFMEENEEPQWHGYFYATLILISGISWSLIDGQTEKTCLVTEMRMFNCITNAIYKKCFRISNCERQNFSPGDVYNLVGVDVERIKDFLPSLFTHSFCFIEVVIAMYFLWSLLGIASIVGLFIMILLIPFNVLIAKRRKNISEDLLANKDKRISLLGEILNGIKMIKFYAWENAFLKRIKDTRKKEINCLRSRAYISGISAFIFESTTLMVALATFTMYILVDPDHVLDAKKAFISISLLNHLQWSLDSMPELVTDGISFFVSLRRVNKFMNATELDPKAITKSIDAGDVQSRVTFENVTISWNENEIPFFENLSFEIENKSLVAIIGRVGSGKSALFEALLGHMNKSQGTIQINGTTAYVAHQAFVQNETFRKNVIFTNDYDEEKYWNVIDCCALVDDLNNLPAGDLTEIGENGINLSGGQKQRLSLARAVYADADIYLLDDPFSSVDSQVEKHLFDKVIGPKGLLKNKTRLLITNKIGCLPKADKIIVLENGKLFASGTYFELAESEKFAEFFSDYLLKVNKHSNLDQLKELEELTAKINPILSRQISNLSKNSSDFDESDETLDDEISLTFGNVKNDENMFLIKEEPLEVEPVRWSVFVEYMKMVGVIGALLTVILYAVSSAMKMYSSIWLRHWTDDQFSKSTNFSQTKRLSVFVFLSLGQILSLLCASLLLNLICLKGAKILHQKMIWSVMRAPLTFFETTLMGKTIKHFSDDLDEVDCYIDNHLRDLILNVFKALTAFGLILLETPLAMFLIIPLGFIYYTFQKFYASTYRQLHRQLARLDTSILSQFSETFAGIATIRAFDAVEYFTNKLNHRIDCGNRCYYLREVIHRWLTIRLEFLGCLSVFIVSLMCVSSRSSLTSGGLGLVLSYAMTINATFNALVEALNCLEKNFISVERCLNYTKIKPEQSWHENEVEVDHRWPSDGAVTFDNYSLKYRPELDLALDNISFQIKSKEKFAIVGRTGSGKSSLIIALFRLVEPASGSIAIDKVDVTKIGLHNLRSKITVIPQEPVIFSGTLKTNLDPLNCYSEEQILSAIELVQLDNFVAQLPDGLNYQVLEDGENLSAGQAQLLCLARALLKKSKIIVIDEGTSSCDMKTDEIIQKVIRKEFNDCTIISIAHRINTIKDFDKAIVLSNGKVKETCRPAELKQHLLFY